ncbi:MULTISPECIES: hypothetical protein [Rhodococcus]|jgi:ABC-type Fe3+-siderophore transport system permease subunit|uniref:Uncharacterized protein n=1 Tax=Rhodococcus cercidiphylli TaxID=489916 RepID=A0ABU4B4G1_9NOCA|nr:MULTISPECIES: hypothetical protein [Rhodococcus]KAA0926315.1 hypothetical protein FQ188_05835 [Rhodococcus sp. ANT_H53B]MDI9924456.1 hypothetical protein [Rhodococcus sp. IEGM 1341]MDV6233380.1 hypothetical protein [Rhodococcus cercidiphylli]MDV8057090.1 hypothetical protein [Rhodococcus sp. IEGM 1343]MDV8077631.1 hypothetical protein [Rhodococcus sp. IEGM 1370]
MESIGRPTPAEARTALDDIDRVQRAVRDTPWPVWLYPVNAVLLAVFALTALVDSRAAFLGVAAVIIAVNVITGYRMGTPWALPTNRGFLTCVALSALCVALAQAVGNPGGPAWPVLLLAIAAASIYSIGSILHYRSTRR